MNTMLFNFVVQLFLLRAVYVINYITVIVSVWNKGTNAAE